MVFSSVDRANAKAVGGNGMSWYSDVSADVALLWGPLAAAVLIGFCLTGEFSGRGLSVLIRAAVG